MEARAKIGHRRLSEETIDLIKEFEGYREEKYLDSAGLETIGYGHLIKRGERLERVTRAEAEELLRLDLGAAQRAVDKVRVPLTDTQYGALVSFVFNVGAGAFSDSTLLRKLNAGDYEGASREFLRWRYAGGKESPGLLRRRERERALFEGKEI